MHHLKGRLINELCFFPHFRRQIAPNIRYGGAQTIEALLSKPNSFVYVFEKFLTYTLEVYAKNSHRDFDILPRRLGRRKKIEIFHRILSFKSFLFICFYIFCFQRSFLL